MFHQIATVWFLILMLFMGLRAIICKESVGLSFEFYGQSALAFGNGIVILAIAWLISWRMNANKFTSDENWPYLLLCFYLVIIIVKMIM